MTYRVGVDIGGTFTDFALFAEEGGIVGIHKQLTTPRDPSLAVIEGIQVLLGHAGVAFAELMGVVHGTTLVTNAVIERRGAPTGMLVTKGFRDILDMRLERRYDLYDLTPGFPDPLVPRTLRREVDERILFDGTAERPVDLEGAIAAVGELVVGHGVEAIAVCFINSYLNAAHERAVRDAVLAEFPDLFVSTSAEVFPNWREFERWTTTTANAYTQPILDRYLRRIEHELNVLGFAGRITMMASNGGMVTPDTARRFPVRMMESGPAAGALMSARHGQALGISDVLSFDMGGTTAKGSLVRAGAPLRTYELEVARVNEFKPGSGVPIKIPVIDMIEIGAGGGSIAEVDERGVIRVGPHSAGADPGPACYGRGGEGATLTDANVVLGYLDPGFFLGGEMTLDPDASGRAIETHVARPLGVPMIRAAWGIHETINEDVARAFRVHAAERGFDYRGCAMIAFGGSGPIHAHSVAAKLKVPRVIFPPAAGVMSALGLLVCPLSFDVARSNLIFVDALGEDWYERHYRALADEAVGLVREAGVPDPDITVIHRLDIRYQGQGFEIEVTLPDLSEPAAMLAAIPDAFSARYYEIFAIPGLDERLEIVNWKVEARAPDPEDSGIPAFLGTESGSPVAQKGSRRAYFPQAGDFIDCPTYDRYALGLGDTVDGPALIEERESTCVLGIGATAHVDARYNIVVEFTPETPRVTGSAESVSA